MKKQNTGKITLFSFILMIFISTFGFNNTGIAYLQMGYASIFWYLLTAIIFFLPCGLMFAEYGSAFENAKGGMYAWLKGAAGEKIAFIGTFTWYASWIVWMISTAPKIWIPFSTMINGSDQTQSWHLLGLSDTATIGLLGILWILIVTFLDCHGIKFITRVSSIGGTFIVTVVSIFCISSLLLLVINHGRLAEPIRGFNSLAQSPNPSFKTFIPIVSFIIYALFAYGGIESMGGMIDRLKHPTRTFPLGIIIATVIIAISYAGTIFLCGVSTNWQQILGHQSVNLGNVLYVIINNLGYVLGKAFGLSTSRAMVVGHAFNHFAGLSLWLGYGGSFFVLLYSPLKSFIMGASKRLLPKRATQLNQHKMPSVALWCQAIFVIIILLIISFSGSNAQKYYLVLTDMTNISMAFPYVFLIGAFPAFKRKSLTRPFVFYKNRTFTNVVTTIVLTVLIVAFVFTAIEPIIEHDYVTAFWTIIGPVLFSSAAGLFYHHQVKKS